MEAGGRLSLSLKVHPSSRSEGKARGNGLASSAGEEGGSSSPSYEVHRAGTSPEFSDPQGHGARTTPAKRESHLRRWATPSREAATFPVPGEPLVTITHVLRHIF